MIKARVSATMELSRDNNFPTLKTWLGGAAEKVDGDADAKAAVPFTHLASTKSPSLYPQHVPDIFPLHLPQMLLRIFNPLQALGFRQWLPNRIGASSPPTLPRP